MSGLDHKETVGQPPTKHDYHAVPIEAAMGRAPVGMADLAGFVQTPSPLMPDRPRSSSPLQAVDGIYQCHPPVVGYRIPRRCAAVVTGSSDSEESEGSEDDSALSTLWAGGSVEQVCRGPNAGDAAVVPVGAGGFSDPVMYYPLSVTNKEDISPQQGGGSQQGCVFINRQDTFWWILLRCPSLQG